MNSRVSMFPCYKWSINLSTYCSGHWGYNDEGSCQIDSRLCLYVTMTGASRRTRFSENTFTNMYIHRFGLNIIELTSVHHSCYMYDYIIKLGRFLWWLFSLNVSPCFQKHCIYKKKTLTQNVHIGHKCWPCQTWFIIPHRAAWRKGTTLQWHTKLITMNTLLTRIFLRLWFLYTIFRTI